MLGPTPTYGRYRNADIFIGEYGFAYLEKMQAKRDRDRTVRMGEIWRFELDPGAPPGRKVEPRVLPLVDGQGHRYQLELPAINPQYNGRRHCFVYGYSSFIEGSGSYTQWALVKKDVCSGETKVCA